MDVSKLPYNMEKPAEMSDITHELVRLIALVSAVTVTYPRNASALLEDGTKEPGQSVLVQSVRLGLALESWVGDAGQDLIKALIEGLPEAFGEMFIAMHAEAHS